MAESIVPLIGTVASISQGEKARKAQKEAAQMQQQTEAKAEAAAESTDRENRMNEAKMNRRKADPYALLASAGRDSKQGAASTMSGTMLGTPMVGRTSLLGR